MNTAKLTRFALTALAALSLAATATAGPGPMYMMINGQMMMVTPMKKDVTFKNGCTVCPDGSMTMGKSKMKLKNGDMVSADGVMIPGAKKAHGG